MKGAIRPAAESVSFRGASGEEQRFPLAEVAEIRFRAPRGADVNIGDARLRRGRFDEAVESYEKALRANAGSPYIRKRIADAKRAKEAVERMGIALVNADHRAILDETARYISIVRPRTLESDRKAALKSAWARQVARATPVERERWRRAADKVGITLAWDERAPEYLAAAVEAAERGAPAAEQVELFAKAHEAHAGFDDKAYFLMAKAYHEAKRDEMAQKFIAQISSLYLKNPEVEALRVSLGVAPPPLKPELLACTFVGGKGDQYISDVGFSSAGAVFGKGVGFTVFYDLRTMKGRVQGDVNTHDESRYNTKPPLPGGRGKAVKDPRNGQTYHVGYRQVHSILQQPFLNSSAGWKLWGWSYADVNPGTKGVRWGPLMADSRAYDCWLMPEGKIGVKCWTDGGNSVLTRDPRDLRKPNPIEKLNPYKKDSGGMASMVMLVDPKDGTPLSGTFLRSHVTRQAVDPWGRVYLPKPIDRASNPFGHADDAGGGLFVLEPSLLRPEVNIRIGGGGSRGAPEVFGYIALRDNIAVLGGTTGAKQMKSANPVQDAPGGGQDGFFAVVRLWDKAR